jgi:hypothetical protein
MAFVVTVFYFYRSKKMARFWATLEESARLGIKHGLHSVK